MCSRGLWKLKRDFYLLDRGLVFVKIICDQVKSSEEKKGGEIAVVVIEFRERKCFIGARGERWEFIYFKEYSSVVE